MSFTAASKELGLTQTAVTLHIKALESKLGRDLFIRRPKSLQLTEMAKAYLPSIQNALEAVDLTTHGLFGPDLNSTIVVRASMAVIIWLAPKLPDFQQRHTNIGIKLVTSIWADTIDTQYVDVDIVLAPDVLPGGHLEKLSEEYLVPVCGLNMAKSVETVADLVRLHPIHIMGFDDHWSRYMAAFGLSYDVRSTRLMVDTSVAACELISQGHGCAVVIERFAKGAIEAGRAIRIVGDHVPLEMSHYLADTKSPKEIRGAIEAFRSWLRAKFELG